MVAEEVLEVGDGRREAIAQGDLGFPAEVLPGEADVGLALAGVVLGCGSGFSPTAVPGRWAGRRWSAVFPAC